MQEYKGEPLCLRCGNREVASSINFAGTEYKQKSGTLRPIFVRACVFKLDGKLCQHCTNVVYRMVKSIVGKSRFTISDARVNPIFNEREK